MSEDRFFQQVNAAMTDYRPEVPESVYAGMRKKLWWSNFTRLSATRFNVWYAALLVTGGLAWFVSNNANTNDRPAAGVIVNEASMVESPVVETSAGSLNQVPASSTTAEAPKQSTSNVAPSVVSKATTDPLIDETAALTDQPESVGETPASEGQLLKETPANQTESSQTKQGAKKGLKVKTFNSTDKK